MNAQGVKSLKMASKVDGTKRPTPMMTKQGASTVLHRGWTETAVATMCVIVQILVFMLKKWTRIVQNEVSGCYGHVVFALSKSTGRVAYTIRAAGRILGIVIGEILHTTNELLGVDLVAALSDVACRDLETGPSDGESTVGAPRAKVAVKWQDTVGHVLGRPSDGAQREQGRQLLRNDPLRQEPNARPETSRGKRTSQSVDEQTTKRVEEPEKRAETIASTPQPTVLKISEVTYDTLPSYSSRPIASLRPDKMAEWRRAKFFADVVPTVTALVTDGRHGGTTTTTEQRHVTPANLSGRRKGRYFTMPLFRWNQRVRSQGLATTRSRAWNDIGVHRSGAVPPPPPGPVPFSPGRHGPFACLPPPCPVPSLHRCPGPFAGPPPPVPAPYSHGHFRSITSPPPPCPVPSSHAHPEPFAGTPPSGPVPSSHAHPGSFAGLPPPGAVPSSHERFVSFAGPTPPGPALYSHGHPGPFVDPRRFPHGRPEPYADPPIHTGSTWAHTVSSRPW